MQSTSVIHCKIQYGNEYRRFSCEKTQFDSLLKQIQTLFALPEDANIAIKYKDEEGDMVTISSDEEMLFAIELFAGSVLRLVVEQTRICRGPRRCENPAFQMHPFHPKMMVGGPHCGHGHRGHGHHGKFMHHGHGHHGQFEHPWKRGDGCRNREKWMEQRIQKLKENPELVEKKIAKITQKRDFINQCIQNNLSDPQSCQRQQHLQWRFLRLEHRLSFLKNLNVSEPSEKTLQPQLPVQQESILPANPITLASLRESIQQAKLKREAMLKVISEAQVDIKLKQEAIQAARTETINAEVKERIRVLKEEIMSMKTKQQERRGELKAHDSYTRDLRTQIQALKRKD